MAIFGEKLKNARADKGWNQKELADRIGITQASISQFEKGLRLPTPANISKFAEILDVSREFLAGDNEAEFEKEMLMRNLKNLPPETLRKINAMVEMIKSDK